jgi:hypothetical protein
MDKRLQREAIEKIIGPTVQPAEAKQKPEEGLLQKLDRLIRLQEEANNQLRTMNANFAELIAAVREQEPLDVSLA